MLALLLTTTRFCDPSEWRFPWAPVQEALDSSAAGHATYAYHKKDGSPFSTTLGMQAERLSANACSDQSQNSSSYIYHVVEGKGRTVIETPSGDKTTFNWDSRDTFAVPAWSKIQHFNESDTNVVYLVAVNDGPFLNLLQLRHPYVIGKNRQFHT